MSTKKNYQLFFITAVVMFIGWSFNLSLNNREYSSTSKGKVIQKKELASLKPHSLGLEKPLPPLAVKSYLVGKGETLLSIWREHRGDPLLLYSALKTPKLKSVISSLKQGEEIKLFFKDKSLVGIQKAVDETTALKVFCIIRGRECLISKISEKVMVEPVTVSVRINSSLAQSFKEKNIPYKVLDDLVDLLASLINFRRDIKKRDKVVVTYQERKTENGKLLSPGYIIAAGLEINRKSFFVVRWPLNSKKAHYFNEKGEVIGSYFLRYPLSFTRITSVFSKARFHPVLKRRRPHNGVDFAAPIGTPVRAAADGRVIFAGYKGASGIMIKIKHSKKYATAYLHLLKLAPTIKKGSRVKRGDVIGFVGKSGLATGPHLHYSFYINGKYVDPLKIKLPLLKESSIKPNMEYIKRVTATLKELLNKTS